jgi:hypothetical protein
MLFVNYLEKRPITISIYNTIIAKQLVLGLEGKCS